MEQAKSPFETTISNKVIEEQIINLSQFPIRLPEITNCVNGVGLSLDDIKNRYPEFVETKNDIDTYIEVSLFESKLLFRIQNNMCISSHMFMENEQELTTVK